ncbi:hypothetical protein MBLNU230_g7101t1 [Neophaeotheca triangularis]
MPSPTPPQRPLVLLFDIGGVCVASPMQAILDYETAHSIPHGYINTAISHSGPNGSWARLERGQIPLDATFFAAFAADLTNEKRWRDYYARSLQKARSEPASQAAEETAFQAPPVPDIDAEALYWSMMRESRQLDRWMWPALRRLRAAADGDLKGELVLGALSNTSIFPEGHPYNDVGTEDGRRHAEMKGVFDVFVSSAHVGLRKPDRPIYELAVKLLDEEFRAKGGGGVEAGDVVFLDDIGTNLRTAKQVGMRTVKVELGKSWKAVKELEKVTGLTLLDDGERAKL